VATTRQLEHDRTLSAWSSVGHAASTCDCEVGHALFREADRFLGKMLFLGHSLVVTPHLPPPRSIAPQYAGSSLNRFFVAEDAAGLVERSGDRLWIHGHTHTPCDYVIGETRVVCNPRGYPGELSNGFNRALVVEV
jgi:hypothetical protein